MNLPAPGSAEESDDESKDEDEEGDDDVQRRRGDSSESVNSESSVSFGLIISLQVILIHQLQCHFWDFWVKMML